MAVILVAEDDKSVREFVVRALREDGHAVTTVDNGMKALDAIIETEFEYEDGVPVYEFKYIDRSGRVRELYVDARTGAILKDEAD